MYNEQLEKLIKMALMDGELTEKEKQVLFKKAESSGINLDEFKIVLEAKLYEKQQSITSKKTETTVAPKSDKLGDIRKCPACGAIVQSFATKCSDCGTEFRNIEASRNITIFFEKLDELESNRKENYSNKKQESSTSLVTLMKWFFFFPIMIISKFTTIFMEPLKPAKWSITDSRKEEMIMNFPVPNSREEIIEFITLSISKIQKISIMKSSSEESKYITKWNSIWKKKAEQVFVKAKLSMKNDKTTIQDLEKILIDSKVIKIKK